MTLSIASSAPSCPAPPRRATSRAPEVVKSAVRVLEVLEFFDAQKSPACVGMVAGSLGFPQSSTSALLRSLVKVGYLRYDPRARTYLPTERVSLLGSWMGRPLFRNGPVLTLVDALRERTGCTVVLGRRTGCEAQLVHVTAPDGLVLPGMRIGATRPLTRCAVGHVLLSTMEDGDLRRLLHRLNAEAEPDSVVRVQDFVAGMAAVRSAGHAIVTDAHGTMLAVRLPAEGHAEPLVLGLAGPSSAFEGRQTALIAILREEVLGKLQPARPGLASFDVPAPFAFRSVKRTLQHASN